MKRTKHQNPSGWHGGNTPYGKTESFDKYVKEWTRFNKQLEELTGLSVTGFDPGINLTKFVDGKYVEGGSIQIPLWFAKSLVERLKLKVDPNITGHGDRADCPKNPRTKWIH